MQEKEDPPKKDPRHDPYGYDRLWSPYRPTVAYVDSLAFGLAIVEMTESVALRYVNGKYIRESDYVPPKASRRYVDHTWTTTRDLPSSRLRLVVYSPYRSVSWSTSFQETKARSLTTGEGVRSCPHGHYVIFFEASADAVTVVRILHGARDLPALFRPDDEAS